MVATNAETDRSMAAAMGLRLATSPRSAVDTLTNFRASAPHRLRLRQISR